MDYNDWLRALGRKPITPRVVKVSGEPDCETDEQEQLGDFAALTPDQWHRAILVRRYYERHPERRG